LSVFTLMALLGFISQQSYETAQAVNRLRQTC
jgi:hypothetical protein